MPYDKRSQREGQIAYFQAVANLKHTLSKRDLKYLSKQHPVGIDPERHILIKQENSAAVPAASRSNALHLVSRELRKCNLATGLALDYPKNQSSRSNQFKKFLYLPRFLVTMTLPHSKVNGGEFSTENGKLELIMTVPKRIGLPYGSYARLILMYLTTKRVLDRERRFELGKSWRDFLKTMQIPWSGGKRGGFKAAQDQLRRLCSTDYAVHIIDENRELYGGVKLTDQWMRSPDGVHVELSERFYILSGESVVPLEVKIVKELRRSPLMLDLYAWLTYRTWTVKHSTIIRWDKLQPQFGANYKRLRDFQAKFRKSLEVVLNHKPVAPQVSIVPSGLRLEPASAVDIDWTERIRQIARDKSL